MSAAVGRITNPGESEPKPMTVNSTTERRSGLFADTISLICRPDSNILDFYFNDMNSNEIDNINVIHQARIILTNNTLIELGKLINNATSGESNQE